MTSKLDEELERLSKAAEQEDDDVRYYGGPTSTHRPARDAYHAALVQFHRTGQLVPAMPSGDVVEAVAEALRAHQASNRTWRMEDLATAAITAYEAASGVAKMRDDQIKHMVNRFLGWKLPENFRPDNGISFEPMGNKGVPGKEYRRDVSGTNLFDAVQAEAMVRFMVEGLPARAALGEKP